MQRLMLERMEDIRKLDEKYFTIEKTVCSVVKAIEHKICICDEKKEYSIKIGDTPYYEYILIEYIGRLGKKYVIENNRAGFTKHKSKKDGHTYYEFTFTVIGKIVEGEKVLFTS